MAADQPSTRAAETRAAERAPNPLAAGRAPGEAAGAMSNGAVAAPMARPSTVLPAATVIPARLRPAIEVRGVRPGRAPAQLDLDLGRELPRFPIEADWKDRARLWGHAFHPMCSYLASFPATLAHAFIARYSRPGDVVLDPFAGRGTVPLQACVEGRLGVGNDLNPFAHVLTAAKVDPPTAARPPHASRGSGSTGRSRPRGVGEPRARAGSWRRAGRSRRRSCDRRRRPRAAGLGVRGPAGRIRPVRAVNGDEPVPLEVALAYHPTTLGQLLFVRSHLDLEDRTDRFLAAALTGILHGKSRSYLSDLMPNTFSMAPRYVRDFAARTAFAGPERDVFACLGEKLGRLNRDGRPAIRGVALLGDARDAGARIRAALRERALPDRARLVVTSPPYLRVLKYGYYNWLRAWFLGFDAAEIDRTLDDAHRREPYLVFLRETLAGLRPALADDAVVVVVIGDVEADRGKRIGDGVGLADAAWEAAAEPEGYRLAGIALDPVAAPRKMTKLWGSLAGQATKTDRILVLGATETGRRRAIAGADLPVRWDGPGGGASATLRP